MGDVLGWLDFAAPALYGGVLIFLRLTTCLMMMPELGTGQVPIRTRVVLGVVITVAIDAGLGLVVVPVPTAPTLIALHLAREILLGAALGLAVRLINATVQMAGDLAGLSMGLSLATFFDLNAGEMPLAMGRLFGLVGSMMFMALGGHLVVVGALFEHLSQHPVGVAELVLPSLDSLVAALQHSIETAVLLASPVIVVALLLNVAMGFVMRVVPSMNLFNIGIGILLAGGFLALALEGDAMVVLLGHEVTRLPEHMSTLAGGP